MVGDAPLRDFYINARQTSGITSCELERRSGVTHPSLDRIERPSKGQKPNNSVQAMLAGLEELGFILELKQGVKR